MGDRVELLGDAVGGGGGVGGDDGDGGGGSYRDARKDEALWSGCGFASADGAGVDASQ